MLSLTSLSVVLILLQLHCIVGFVKVTPRRMCTSIVNAEVEKESSASQGFAGYTPSLKKEGAYASAANSSTILPVIIVVNPYMSENVGSCARTMLNFGLHELRVVDPRCDILNDRARALAAGGSEILENAKIYATIQECVEDLQMVMATTIRPRHMTQIILSPSSAAEKLVIPSGTGQVVKSGIMFGRERNGLNNEEVALADAIISISTFKQFSSLNLAQAVNIVGYELFKAKIKAEDTSAPDVWLHPRDGERLATRKELDNLMNRLEQNLDSKAYQKDGNKRDYSFRNIRNIVQRTLITRAEVDLLQGVLSVLVRPTKDKDSSQIETVEIEGEIDTDS